MQVQQRNAVDNGKGARAAKPGDLDDGQGEEDAAEANVACFEVTLLLHFFIQICFRNSASTQKEGCIGQKVWDRGDSA
jgi:hypothetical protein